MLASGFVSYPIGHDLAHGWGQNHLIFGGIFFGVSGSVNGRPSKIKCRSPTIFRRLIGECDEPDQLASSRCIQLAGEPLFRSDVDAYHARFGHRFDLYNGMGTSETSCLTR